ncbi:cysteine synthase A [Suicoccus acidiformans]|uniref:cysteine synthase n=1 Tax=Suicoccus acidiformans TaxID=2036206 RepID=A0A347WN74_9LACT|nr:cysteine synthase A [Suicoccus acidiformans]AXY26531.1 cysteine synthase A [Suicoccus acidiformans]
MLFENIIDTIGKTPLVKLKDADNRASIYVKVESFNPSGSVKDRPVKYILKDLMDQGILKEGDTIIEQTSGNTGVGLAMASASLGLKAMIVMPDTMTVERHRLMQAYGAELVLTPGSEGMAGAKAKAQELSEELDAPIFGQFTNQANVKAHEETTAKEILADLPDVAAFVAGIGTGGTVTGVGKTLKANDANTIIWGVEPTDSPLLSEGKAGSHKIQGIGANFVPDILDQKVIDRIFTVTNDQAIDTMVKLAKTEGILAGVSAGANVYAALQLAEELGAGKKVVTVLPDTGERYLSSGFFGDEGAQ